MGRKSSSCPMWTIFGRSEIDVFVVDVEDERVNIIMCGTVDIGPLVLWNRGQAPIAGKQVIAVGKRRYFGN